MVSGKQLLTEAMVSLAEKEPIGKITVKDLCATANVSKQTFYNHFLDKYDLIAHIFMQDIQPVPDEKGLDYTEEELQKQLERIWEKRRFYKEAFSEDTQNSLSRYIEKYSIELNEKLLREHLGTDTLSEELLFSLRYHSYGCVRFTEAWVLGEVSISPEDLAKAQFRYMPEELKAAWQTHSK